MKELTANTSLSHYRIVRKIGAGGMGEVYLAENTKLHRQVALKILPAELINKRERVRRFEQEARAASSLNHPNILTVHEIGAEGDTHFIATEYVEGESLRAAMTRNQFELGEILDVAGQIASALAAAHARGIIHRDIKPENVMIRHDGLVKVLDFGLAKLNELPESNVNTQAETKILMNTAPGVVMGTPAYMSPEQARGLEIDARTDIWSLGVIIYEMLTRRLPFAGETASDCVASILKTDPTPLDENAPAELQRIVRKTLQKKKDERYQTAKDLQIDLKNLKHDLAFSSELERSAPANKKGAAETRAIDAASTDAPRAISNAEHISGNVKKRRIGFAVGAAVLLLAAIGFGVWFLLNRAAHTQRIESIAVMPFTNESGNPDNEYLSDGMTETLIGSLSQLPKLSVKARSSVFRYKGRDADARAVGKELNVQAILTGRVTQRGQDLTLYLSLVDAANEDNLWSKQYNRQLSNLVALQNEIARDVSNNLKTKLSGADEQKLTKNYTENAEAYQLYLKGRFYWLKFPAKGFEKSRDYYQQAIDADPNFALAHAGLSEYYGLGTAEGLLPPAENWSRSEAAAKKALALDDTLPDAYNALAGVKQFNFDEAGAEKDLLRAIELNPNYAEGRNHYSFLLAQVGRLEESLAQSKKVLELEPLSVGYNRTLAKRFFQTRDYERAVEQYQKTLELDPNDAFTHEQLGNTYEQKGMPKEAVAEWSKALRLTEDYDAAATLERAFTEWGFNAAVRTLWPHKLKRLNEKAERGEYVPAMDYALAYTRLADKEQAFAWLAKAEKERNSLIFETKLDPVYNNLRDDPRFQDLLRRVGFSA